MTRKQRVARISLVPLAVALVGIPMLLHQMQEKDRQHARFYNSGKTINAFLKDYCGALEQAVNGGGEGHLMDLYSQAYASPDRGEVRFADLRDMGAVSARPLQAQGRRAYSRQHLESEIASYLGEVASLDKTICKIDLIEEMDLEVSARLTVKLIFDGHDPQGQAFQDRIFYRWQLVNEGEQGTYLWRIVSDQLVEGIRVAGDRQALVSADLAAMGVDFRHRRDPNLHMKDRRQDLEFGVIQHASGGISAADYDADGLPDLLLLDGVASRLYHNDGPDAEGTPRFRDVTEEVGLGGLDRAHVGLFADYDDDGDRDLFVGRYLAENRYYENVGDAQAPRFVERGRDLGLADVVPSTSATLLDFDLDGDLDIYLGLNGNAFEEFPRLPFYATNGRANRLYRNDGESGFTDVTEASGTGDSGWTLAVASGDVNGDGYPDLAVSNDFGRKGLYLNNGDGSFREIAKEAGVLDFSGGMGLAFGDFDDDGLLDLYTSNINSNQRWFGEDMTVGQYMRNVATTRWALLDVLEYADLYRLIGSDWIELGQQIGEGNSVFRNLGSDADGDVAFEEIKDSHADRAGWGWSVAFFDLDNDTDLDLYAANGWISNTPGTDL